MTVSTLKGIERRYLSALMVRTKAELNYMKAQEACEEAREDYEVADRRLNEILDDYAEHVANNMEET